MTLASLLLYLPGMLAGFFLVHLLWPERNLYALILRASLGPGLGLGVSSLLYFINLLAAPERPVVLPLMLLLAIALLAAVILRWHNNPLTLTGLPRPTRLQWALAACALTAAALMLLAFGNLVTAQPQGAFDAWAIWDRAARFIYRDPLHWQAALSPDLYWATHPDYPLLVPLNSAWVWGTLGAETVRTPAVQALCFLVGSLGLVFGGVGLTRSLGQAALGVLLLGGTPFLALSASGLLADVPIMYYLTASLVLMFLALTREPGALMVLSGFMAGLAAWTKNEGLLFLLAAVLGLTLTRYADLRRSLVRFALGAALPLAAVLIFKSLAPPNDMLGAGASLSRLVDPARWLILLRALGGMVLRFGDWPISLPLLLAVYALVMRLAPPPGSKTALFTVAFILALQFLGDCAIYLLTPHDLAWHLGTSLARVLLQLFPAALVVFLLTVREPERVS